MEIGASTSNFYPAPVETALDTVLAAGFSTVEIFLNAPSEREPAFVDELRRRADGAGAVVCALHPYSSFMEPYFLFSLYERRFTDMLEDYKHYFEAAARLGARYLVLHGDKVGGKLPVERSLERYERLYDLGATFGVRVAQENVVRYRSEELTYLRALRQQLGDKAAFVLDIKQTVRCSLPIEEVADAMGDRIVHVHVSDHTAARDCLPPGTGAFDYGRLFSLLRQRQYDGALILELYRDGFDSAEDLIQAAEFLKKYQNMV
ncbi:MAG: sugar phosphate isomerase/epimerase [Clostridia bacterium]|nr:sugar phosphate isomerase/epimerase [Clostridia bacterium]